MAADLILASGSEIRRRMLESAGLTLEIESPRVDEESIRAAVALEGASPRETADTLAEVKAAKVAGRRPEARVLGCDQVLDIDREGLAKPSTRDEAAAQLRRLRGKTHRLLSAAVLFEGAEPVWRHVGVARLTMRPVSDAFIEAYLDRNWPGVATSVGAYKIEEEGARLFAHVQGDLFTIQGLPLFALLNFLTDRGTIPG
ncbi:Maf family protein [Citreimonas salinaria]|uniref:Nucleoside triphosphate pyrophosphatase n=1 Tax=Citreimonas salinaria TaxID=321339 RepID=A0A1H3FCP5_9RHOB|nr:Maf family protein [Citreimonas salinaria]SDX88853.1 septum formation protein [Citreimonas salinaria]